MLLFVFHYRKKKLLEKKHACNVNIVEGLILPFYFHYIYFYLAITLVTGILNVIIEYGISNNNDLFIVVLPIENGFFHCLYEGLAFYLMRSGAGISAIYRALGYGLVCSP